MKISAILILLAVLGGSTAPARAEAPDNIATPETVSVPYYTGSVVMPEPIEPEFTDNLTPIEVEGETGYIDQHRRFVGLSQ
jgi:hypothetical protein